MSTLRNRRIAFLGGKLLSAACLRHLHEYCRAGQVEIVAVLPRPKGERGWWSMPGVPEMYETAEALGMNIIAREEDLLSYEIDLGCSVLYHRILPPHIIQHPASGFVNLHCAPLPHYRGCNTCSHAILNGESRFGATLHYMDAKVDHGNVIEVAWFDMPPDVTARRLMAMTEEIALGLFCDCLPALLANEVAAVPQAEIIRRQHVVSRRYSRSSLGEPGVKQIDLDWPEEKILRHVRAFDFEPFEPAYCVVAGRKVYLRMSYTGQETTKRPRHPTPQSRRDRALGAPRLPLEIGSAARDCPR